jgi:tetratricopeptide (TPR) repeat protein
MSPFKSEHSVELELDTLMQWQSMYNEARELQLAGRLDQALVKYRQALVIDDRYAELHYRIGQVLFEQLRYDEAEAAFRRAVEEDVAPLRILSPMQTIVADVAEGEHAALIDFPAIMRQAYLDRYGHSVFGSEYFTDHVHTNAEGYYMLGRALFEHLVERGIARPDISWNSARAEAVRREVLADIDTEDEGISLLSLGSVMEWAGKFEEARTLLLRALEILGPAEDIYMRLASSYYALGRLDDAFDYLEKLQALSPDLPGLYTKLGMIRLEQGQPGPAIEYCMIELGLKPNNHQPHVCIANSLVVLGKSNQAQPYYETALALKPDSDHVLLSYAEYLITQKRYDQALHHASKALGINPANYEAHNTIASIMLGLGDQEQARHHIVEALRLEPGYEDARQNLQLLQAGFNSTGQDQLRSREM